MKKILIITTCCLCFSLAPAVTNAQNAAALPKQLEATAKVLTETQQKAIVPGGEFKPVETANLKLPAGPDHQYTETKPVLPERLQAAQVVPAAKETKPAAVITTPEIKTAPPVVVKQQ